MFSVTVAKSPAVWGRAELSHMGTSFSNFRSFPALLNSPHEALSVIMSKFHNNHNSETSNTIFPLKELMHISKILTCWSRQKKWNPANIYYETLTHTNAFYPQNICETEKQYLHLTGSDWGTRLSKILVLWQRGPQAETASKSPETNSGLPLTPPFSSRENRQQVLQKHKNTGF